MSLLNTKGLFLKKEVVHLLLAKKINPASIRSLSIAENPQSCALLDKAFQIWKLFSTGKIISKPRSPV